MPIYKVGDKRSEWQTTPSNLYSNIGEIIKPYRVKESFWIAQGPLLYCLAYLLHMFYIHDNPQIFSS